MKVQLRPSKQWKSLTGKISKRQRRPSWLSQKMAKQVVFGKKSHKAEAAASAGEEKPEEAYKKNIPKPE